MSRADKVGDANASETYAEVGLEALKVEPDGVLVVVRVGLDLKSRVLGDGDVVAPGRGGKVDGLGVGVEALEERGSDPESAGAGDGLGHRDLEDKRGSGRGQLAFPNTPVLQHGLTRFSLRGTESGP